MRKYKRSWGMVLLLTLIFGIPIQTNAEYFCRDSFIEVTPHQVIAFYFPSMADSKDIDDLTFEVSHYGQPVNGEVFIGPDYLEFRFLDGVVLSVGDSVKVSDNNYDCTKEHQLLKLGADPLYTGVTIAKGWTDPHAAVYFRFDGYRDVQIIADANGRWMMDMAQIYDVKPEWVRPGFGYEVVRFDNDFDQTLAINQVTPTRCDTEVPTIWVETRSNGYQYIVGGPYDGYIYVPRSEASEWLSTEWKNIAGKGRIRITFGIRGTDEDDIIFGTFAGDTIHGEDGDDIICGFGGDDSIFGWSGDDRLYGGVGNDWLDGKAGNDTLVTFYDEERDVLVNGGKDWDTCYINPEIDFEIQCEDVIFRP